MNKRLPLFCAGVLSLSALQAQNAVVISSPEVPIEYNLVAVSPNGKWACGNINDGYYRAFRWNLVTNEMIELSPRGEQTAALSVSDDGKVAGFFQDSEGVSNHATIEKAGYWFNGCWHHIDGQSAGSMGYAISPNGKLLAGTALLNGSYSPVVWNLETGEQMVYTFHNPSGKGAAAIYAIANNGAAAGFEYHPLKANRTPIIWTAPNDTILPDYANVGPWSTCNSISEDGTKVLVVDKVYDITTRTATQFVSFNSAWAYEFRKVNNDGTVIGYTQSSMETAQEATIYVDGQLMSVMDYLKSRGLDISATYPSILEARGLTEDRNVMSIIAYDNNAIPRSLTIRFNENTATPAPVALLAQPLTGASAVKLSWNAPSVKDAKPTRYELLRNGQTVYSGTALSYIDNGLSDGTYTYTVQAVYDAGVSDISEVAVATLTSKVASSAPTELAGIQRGYNNVGLTWEAPAAMAPTVSYQPANYPIYSIGGGIYSFETGARFEADVLSAYAAKEQTIGGVSFYPMSAVKEWTINIYAADDLKTPLYSQKVDAAGLTYGVSNYVALTTPFTAPAGKDIVVGIQADVDSNAENYSVQGLTYGWARPGYTDLMHRVNLSDGTTEDFYSLHDYTLAQGDNSYIYDVCWPIGISFGTAAEAQSYVVYADGEKVATSTMPQYIVNAQTEGVHTYEVLTVYTDGTEGPKAGVDVRVANNTQAYVPQNVTVTVEGTHVKASWDAVDTDRNRTNLQYCSDEASAGMVGTEENNYSYQVRNIFSSDMLRPFDGYQVTALRFYPLCDATYTFFLSQNGKEVANVEVENYETNKWNVVKLPTPVTISRADELSLTLDMWDVDLNKAPLARDTQVARAGESDLYSLDGDTWKSVTEETSTTTGNWLIGIVAETPEGSPVKLNSYDVLVNNRSNNTTPLTTNAYEFDFDKTGSHTLRVRANTEVGQFSSETKRFTIGIAGISDLTADMPIHVTRGAEAITVDGGDITALVLYNAAGRQCASVQGNTISITGMAAGTYVLSITTADGKVFSQKVALL